MKNQLEKKHTNPLLYLLAGAAVGGIIAILLAPDSGADTRNNIAETAKKSWDTLKDSITFTEEDVNKLKEKALTSIKTFAKTAEEAANV